MNLWNKIAMVFKRETSDLEKHHSRKIPEDLVSNKDSWISSEAYLNKSHSDLNQSNSSSEKLVVHTDENNNKMKEIEEILSSNKKFIEEDLFLGVESIQKFHKEHIDCESAQDKQLDVLLYKKIHELKNIKNDWLIKSKKLLDLKDELVQLEKNITDISVSVDSLLKEKKKDSLFSKKTTKHKAFKLKDTYLHSINDLVNALKTLSDEDFKIHVNHEKNDFADWIFHVFNLEDLSAKIKNYLNKEDFLRALKEDV